MQIYTKWISYDGKIGITDNYDYYLMDSAQIMDKEVHQGSIYYRCNSSSKRYSFNKINKTKRLEQKLIFKMPF